MKSISVQIKVVTDPVESLILSKLLTQNQYIGLKLGKDEEGNSTLSMSFTQIDDGDPAEKLIHIADGLKNTAALMREFEERIREIRGDK